MFHIILLVILPYEQNLRNSSEVLLISQDWNNWWSNPLCISILGYLERSDNFPPVDACDLLSYLVLIGRVSFRKEGGHLPLFTNSCPL